MTTATLWDTLQDAYSTRRQRGKHARKLAPLAVLCGALRVAGALSRAVADRWARARTTLFSYGAFGCFTAAAWTWHLAAGLVVLGGSLLVIELLSGRGGE